MKTTGWNIILTVGRIEKKMPSAGRNMKFQRALSGTAVSIVKLEMGFYNFLCLPVSGPGSRGRCTQEIEFAEGLCAQIVPRLRLPATKLAKRQSPNLVAARGRDRQLVE